jgi:hypothetical protein
MAIEVDQVLSGYQPYQLKITDVSGDHICSWNVGNFWSTDAANIPRRFYNILSVRRGVNISKVKLSWT